MTMYEGSTKKVKVGKQSPDPNRPSLSDEFGDLMRPKHQVANLPFWKQTVNFGDGWLSASKNNSKANDNSQGSVFFRWKVASIAFAAIFLISIFTLNFSVIATQAVVQADDQALVAAMDLSPEALAFALNAMEVGETE